MDHEESRNATGSWFRGLVLILSEWMRFHGWVGWLAIGIFTLTPLLNLGLLLLSGALIDALVQAVNQDSARVFMLLSLMGGVWLGSRLVNVVYDWVVQHDHVSRDSLFTRVFYGHLARLPPSVFEDARLARSIHLVGNGLYRAFMLPSSVFQIFSMLILILGMLIILCRENVLLGAGFLLILLGDMFLTMKHGSRVYHISDVFGDDQVKAKAYIDPIEMADMDERVELFIHKYGRWMYERAFNLLFGFAREIMRAEKKRFFQLVLWGIVRTALLTGLVGILVVQVLEGRTPLGMLVVLLGFLLQLDGFLEGFLDNVNFIILNLHFLREIDVFLRLRTEEEKGVPLRGDALEIRFENVWFKYPGMKRWVLRGVSFTIKPGEKVALVGVNGAGKTTLIRLLLGIYTPQKGRILVNGVPLEKVDKRAYYERLGVLSQHALRMHIPVREAFEMSRSGNIDEAEVWRSLREVGLEKRVRRFAHGLDTWLFRQVKDGVELSGGEWQRLNAARMLYRSPELLILDEPTSNMDALAEKALYELLFKRARERGMSLLLVTHRLASIVRADRILVLDKGKIVCEGTHRELLRSCPLYRALWDAQYSGEKE